MNTLIVLPGQGLGARDVLPVLARHDDLVDQASRILEYPLLRRVRLAAKTPRRPMPTELAQPAIFVASIAGWRECNEEPAVIVGHSLGEYAALVAGGALTFRNALRVVHARARAMSAAGSASPGGMVALLGLTLEEAREVARSGGVTVANDNAPGQVVVAGDDAGLRAAAALAVARGGRCVRLTVDGAFHTAAMAPAGEAVRAALDHVDVRSPRVPVVANATARPYRSPGEIRKLLVDGLTAPVRFRESVEYAWTAGARRIVDVGPGSVAATMARRTMRTLQVLAHA